MDKQTEAIIKLVAVVLWWIIKTLLGGILWGSLLGMLHITLPWLALGFLGLLFGRLALAIWIIIFIILHFGHVPGIANV